jgi:hypothetical protein
METKINAIGWDLQTTITKAETLWDKWDHPNYKQEKTQVFGQIF